MSTVVWLVSWELYSIQYASNNTITVHKVS